MTAGIGSTDVSDGLLGANMRAGHHPIPAVKSLRVTSLAKALTGGDCARWIGDPASAKALFTERHIRIRQIEDGAIDLSSGLSRTDLAPRHADRRRVGANTIGRIDAALDTAIPEVTGDAAIRE